MLLKGWVQGFRNRIHDQGEIRAARRRLDALARTTPGGLEFVFYAESRNDWIYFEGLVLELLERRGKTVVYLTSSRDDGVFELGHENLHAFYIGEGAARTMLFRSIDCTLFLMTLTDLDQLFLKRSVRDVHYVYLFHAIVSAHMVYRERSFNGYDSFLAVGPHHEREIEALCRFYELDAKEVVPFGYYRLEKLLTRNAIRTTASSVPASTREVLIAPSWGDHSITCTVAEDLIATLLESDYRITFRPHPMSLRRDADRLARLETRFAANDRVVFDLDIRSSASLERADLMISDWSGSAFEFAFGFEKPVLFVDTRPKVNNADFDAFSRFCRERGESLEPIEKSLRSELGDTLQPGRLEAVAQKIDALLADPNATRDRLVRARERTVYNLESGNEGVSSGRSSQAGADHLIALSAKLRGRRRRSEDDAPARAGTS